MEFVARNIDSFLSTLNLRFEALTSLKCVEFIALKPLLVVSYRLDRALTERFLIANLFVDMDGLVTPIG